MKIHKYKTPTTKFLDEQSAITVELLNWPDLARMERVFVDVINGHHKTGTYDNLTFEQKKTAIQQLLDDNVLPKGMLMMNFTFVVKNISLTITHMICRQKFFHILQRSTAVTDLRNESFVMPRSFNRDKEYYEKVKQWYLQGKELFCEGVDKKGLSVQDCRTLIPKNNANHMYVHANLLALKGAFDKRLDSCEEPIPSVIVCEKMIALIETKFPYLKGFFTRSCDRGACLHSKPGKYSNIVFRRDELHKKFLPKDYDLEAEKTLHNKTRDDMNAGPKIREEVYYGRIKVGTK